MSTFWFHTFKVLAAAGIAYLMYVTGKGIWGWGVAPGSVLLYPTGG
jgi:hypothetical protein